MVVTTELATMNMMQLKYVPGNTTALDHPHIHPHCAGTLQSQFILSVELWDKL